MKAGPLIIILFISSCEIADQTDCDNNLHNTPGGAYAANLTLESSDCPGELPQFNEWVWADVWPINNDSEYHLAFWKFDLPKVRLYAAGEVRHQAEELYWPRLYQTITTGYILNQKIGLNLTLNYYELDSDDNRKLICARNFALSGTKFLDYPDPPRK